MANLSIARESSPIANPIDIVEELVSANEWAFERASDEEMLVEVVGRWASYRMHFVWQQDLSSMYFSCLLDAKVPSTKRAAASELVALINERMWLGHFEMWSGSGLIIFRHSTVLDTRDGEGLTLEQAEAIAEAALEECERFYPVFQFVLWGGKSPGEAIAAALIDTHGEA